MREGVRIAKALSILGRCSRREAEHLVLSGRVVVNGAPIATAATLVDPARDSIVVDGERLGPPAAHRYYAVHKPRGVVSTVRDPHASHTVVQLVPLPERLYPVGRLDKDSEGLILLTNDGDFAHSVMHPRYGVEKEYQALVPRAPTEAELNRLAAGIPLEGRVATAVEATTEMREAQPWVRLVLLEGRRHEARRLLAAVGLPVRRLIRTRIGPVHLGRLTPGAYRELRPGEVEALRGALPSPSGRAGG